MDTLPIGGVGSERGQHLAFYFSVVPTVNPNPIRVVSEEPLRHHRYPRWITRRLGPFGANHLPSKLLQKTRVSNIASESDFVGYGHKATFGRFQQLRRLRFL